MIKYSRQPVITLVLALALLLTALTGCGSRTASEEPSGPAAANQPAAAAEPAGEVGSEGVPERQDGERFEAVIILEGMEETVRYEHVRNDRLGFGMDYDYELFVRQGGADSERFVSVYDDPDAPENYLEVIYNPHDAQTVAAALSAFLSQYYELSRDDSFPLDRAGSCIRIDASAEPGGLTMPAQLQMVSIVPAGAGCRIAAAHYAIESAEGFGRRFHYLMNTFSAIAAPGETRLSDDQAVSAVRHYCYIRDPELDGIVTAGEYPVYWDISSSDESEVVVVFRSYTGALNRFYIDPVSGDAYVTEFVSGITDGEQRTDEALNAWDYVF